MALARSAQANSMWCLKAMRNLWESQDGALWERLGRVPEHRRQFYANCVKRLEIPSLAARSLAQMKLIVQGVTFNRLRHVSIHLRGYQRNIAFPNIDAPNVRVIHIHGVYVEILGQDRHRMMRNLACHVKVCSKSSYLSISTYICFVLLSKNYRMSDKSVSPGAHESMKTYYES